jgi:hypothetical protein
VIKWSLQNQLRWKTNLVRKVVSEERPYYLEVVKYSLENLMLYPYHLSEVRAISMCFVFLLLFYDFFLLGSLDSDERPACVTIQLLSGHVAADYEERRVL